MLGSSLVGRLLSCVAQLALTRRSTLDEERPLSIRHIVGSGRGPLERGIECGTAKQFRCVTPIRLPTLGRGDDALANALSDLVLLEPGTQARPFTQERLVGNLDPLAVTGEQAAFDEALDRKLRRCVAGRRDLVE